MKTQFSKIILTGLLMLILVGKAQSQTCTMSIGSRIKCPVDTVWVPVKFYAFDQPNVGSINIDSIQLPTDTNILVFRNQPGDCIPGALFANGWNSNYNAVTRRFKISWSSATPVVADSGIICYMKCYYKSAAIATISFLQSNMYVTDETGSVSYNINFIDGTVSDGLSGITVSASPKYACCGDSVFLLTSGETGVTSWSWSGPGGFSSTAQNPVIIYNCTGGGSVVIYTLSAGNGCGNRSLFDTVFFTSGYASFFASPNPVCIGGTLTLNGYGFGVNSWSWSGQNGFTSNVQNPAPFIITSLAQAGNYQLVTTSACGVSNISVFVHVYDSIEPTVVISASPPIPVAPGSTIVYTAAGVNGGNPVFYWYKNGLLVSGNTSTFTLSNYADGDVICCSMTSNALCAAPLIVTACDTILTTLGIENSVQEISFISEVFPNPVNENSVIRLGVKNPTGMQMQVFDITGRQLSEKHIELTIGENEITIDNQKLTSGVYRLVLQMNDGSTMSRAFVK